MADVVVVDDSQFMRAQIRDLLESGGHTVVAEASDGFEAVSTVAEHDPDVVTMDVKMPGMDGIEAVEEIMDSNPTPVLMLSRYTEDGAETTFEALDAGAVDFFRKPGGEISTDLLQYADDLVERVAVVARADVSTALETPTSPSTGAVTAREGRADPATVVIAASTGGPSVVESVLAGLPSGVGLRVLVVQHMPDQFTGRFADRLDGESELAIREASGGRLGTDEVVLARGDFHLEVREELGSGLDLVLTEDDPVHNVRPAADVALRTAAEAVTGPLVGVVISGMGADATEGLDHVKRAGGTTIAQDPETARIAGMPQRAIEAGVVDDVCPPGDIPATILGHLDR